MKRRTLFKQLVKPTSITIMMMFFVVCNVVGASEDGVSVVRIADRLEEVALHSTIISSCGFSDELEILEVTKDKERGDEVKTLFRIAKTLTYESDIEAKALFIRQVNGTNKNRDVGVQVVSVNGLDLSREDSFLDERDGEFYGDSLVVCLPSDDGYTIEAYEEMTRAKNDNNLEWIGSYVAPAGGSPKIKTYIAY